MSVLLCVHILRRVRRRLLVFTMRPLQLRLSESTLTILFQYQRTRSIKRQFASDNFMAEVVKLNVRPS